NAPPACPKVPLVTRLLVESCEPGNWKLVWFSTLNTSQRNCSPTRSVTLMFLNSETSALKYFGPTKVFLPRLPAQPAHGRVKKVVPEPGVPSPLKMKLVPKPFAH